MEVLEVISDYEIERGKPMPSKQHALVQTRISGEFYANIPKYLALSEISLDLKGKEKVPDLAIYEKATFETEGEEIRTIQIPLAVVEILSPTQNINELVEKSKIYFENGIKSYWLVVPVLKSVFIYHEYGNFIDFQHQEILKDEVLGVELDLKMVF
jgi:Uma2 family endonuclease